MPRLFSSMLLSSALIFWAIEATATPVLFTDSQAFANAVVGDELFLLDFEGFPVGPLIDGSSISSGIVFSSPEASNPSTVRFREFGPGERSLGDSGGAAPNDVGPLRGQFMVQVSSMKMVLLGASEIGTLTLFDSTDALIGQFATPSTGGFVGVVSDVQIARFDFLGGLFANGGRDRAPIDDFAAYGVIPEPGTGLLVIAGLLGVAGWRRART